MIRLYRIRFQFLNQANFNLKYQYLVYIMASTRMLWKLYISLGIYKILIKKSTILFYVDVLSVVMLISHSCRLDFFLRI